MTAYRCGTPQIVIPNVNDCQDQLYHGRRVALRGCGVFLRPRINLDVNSGEISEAVCTILQSYPTFKEKCMVYSEKLRSIGTGEGLSTTVEALRQLIAGVMLKNRAGKWVGWTSEAIQKDLMTDSALGSILWEVHKKYEPMRKAGIKLMERAKSEKEVLTPRLGVITEGEIVMSVDQMLGRLESRLF